MRKNTIYATVIKGKLQTTEKGGIGRVYNDKKIFPEEVKSMIEYSEKVLEHFKNPRNAGVIEDADGIGEIGDKNCGDVLRVFIKVARDKVTDVKFQIRGCGAAIACASAMTELAIGKGIDDALMVSEDDIMEALDGLPEAKLHCSNLGAAGLRKAILDYFEKNLTKECSNEI